MSGVRHFAVNVACRTWRGAAMLWAAFAVACAPDSGTNASATDQPWHEPDVTLASALTPSTHALLSGGEFAADHDDPGGITEISPARASELAVAFVRQFGKYNASIFQQPGEQRIDLDSLTPTGRVFLARSPYGALDERFSKPSRKALGSYYIVNLMLDRRPVLSVAVSALASDVDIRDGRLVFPKRYGNEFIVLPVPLGRNYPISPELASRFASQRTGRQVRGAPVLIAPPVNRFFAPQYSMWRVILDRPTNTAALGPSGSDTVYVDWDGAIWERTLPDVPDRRSMTIDGTAREEEVVLPSRPGIASRLAARHMHPN